MNIAEVVASLAVATADLISICSRRGLFVEEYDMNSAVLVAFCGAKALLPAPRRGRERQLTGDVLPKLFDFEISKIKFINN